MTADDIDRLEAPALSQRGWEIGTVLTITPGDLAELCRMARIGLEQEGKDDAG